MFIHSGHTHTRRTIDTTRLSVCVSCMIPHRGWVSSSIYMARCVRRRKGYTAPAYRIQYGCGAVDIPHKETEGVPYTVRAAICMVSPGPDDLMRNENRRGTFVYRHISGLWHILRVCD